ncbi:MAG: hypothetical protein RL199_1192 [Pseudomonadota bacterium]|jgi:hypothetical protein
MRAPVRLAPEVGARLGRGPLLLGALPARAQGEGGPGGRGTVRPHGVSPGGVLASLGCSLPQCVIGNAGRSRTGF